MTEPILTRRNLLVGAAVLAAAAPFSGPWPGAEADGLTLATPAFDDGQRVPDRYTCRGEDISPPFRWTGVPEAAASLALLVSDPDAPRGTWWHWAIFDIPPERTGLPEGVAAKARVGSMRQAVNDFRNVGYGGPCPPRGDRAHRYRFRLLALDVASLDLGDGPRCRQVAAAAKGHVLAEAVVTGRFSR